VIWAGGLAAAVVAAAHFLGAIDDMSTFLKRHFTVARSDVNNSNPISWDDFRKTVLRYEAQSSAFRERAHGSLKGKTVYWRVRLAAVYVMDAAVLEISSEDEYNAALSKKPDPLCIALL
jgi:hypothetical protein